MILQVGKIPYRELTGLKFGHLTAIQMSIVPKYGKNKIFYLCNCDCGNHATVAAGNLITGNSKTCGMCYLSHLNRGTHRKRQSREYAIWCAMKRRCTNSTVKEYSHYGGRGISVCDRWLNSFENFYADMGDRPSEKHSIDRIDTNGNYEPSNCRWASMKEQQRNRRDNVMLIHQGKCMCVSAWAEELSLPIDALYARLKKGWSIPKALETKIRRKSCS